MWVARFNINLVRYRLRLPRRRRYIAPRELRQKLSFCNGGISSVMNWTNYDYEQLYNRRATNLSKRELHVPDFFGRLQRLYDRRAYIRRQFSLYLWLLARYCGYHSLAAAMQHGRMWEKARRVVELDRRESSRDYKHLVAHKSNYDEFTDEDDWDELI